MMMSWHGDGYPEEGNLTGAFDHTGPVIRSVLLSGWTSLLLVMSDAQKRHCKLARYARFAACTQIMIYSDSFIEAA